MKVLFLLHEQYGDYKCCPAYTELVKPFLASGYVKDYKEFIYQRILRERKSKSKWLIPFLKSTLSSIGLYRIKSTTSKDTDKPQGRSIYTFLLKMTLPLIIFLLTYSLKIYQKIKSPLAHIVLEKKLYKIISTYKPHLIVSAPTFPGENIRSHFLKKIKKTYPEIKIYTQLWDSYDHLPKYLRFEKACFIFSDMLGIMDSFSRYNKIINKEGLFKDYPNVNKLHWHPTIFDPDYFQCTNEEKLFDIAIFGSAEKERIKYIQFLSQTYKEDFYHFGGFVNHINNKRQFIPKEDYALLLNQTKIAVNTQTYYYRLQLKGKVREALSCGTFLLEEDNPETRAFVKEGFGVVYFKNISDLKSKIDYYLENEEKRESIAKKGHEWFKKNYNAKKWVEYIIQTIGLDEENK